MTEELKYKDEKGKVIEGHHMVKRSDMERYNDILEKYYKLIRNFLIAFIVLILWVIWKILSSGAVNTYIARCV